MNRDDIIAMAREAEGIQFNYRPSEEFVYFAERFASLVAAAERKRMEIDSIHTCHAECQRPACVAVRKAVKAEREACARVCDEYAQARYAAEAIRERGGK